MTESHLHRAFQVITCIAPASVLPGAAALQATNDGAYFSAAANITFVYA